jgi:hypothetical protein
MTDKARAVLNRLKLNRLFRPGEKRLSTQVEVGPRGTQEGSRFLSEMNFLVDEHEEFVKSLAPRVVPN